MRTFFYDGTFNGYLSVIFQIYTQKKEPTNILQEECSNGVLGEYIFVATDKKEAKRVERGIVKKLGGAAAYEFKVLFLSELAEFEMIGYRFLKTAFKNPEEIKNLGNIEVKAFKKTVRRVLNEKHKLLGFIRFEKVEEGFFFSEISPDFNQLPIIGEEFIERLKEEKFIIFDRKREVAFFYENGVSFLTHANIDGEVRTSKEDRSIQDLWKIFFRKIAIKERKNFSLQRSKVPLKYRDYMVEFKEN